MVLLFLPLRGFAERSERKYVFTKFMDCMKTLDGVDKEPICFYHRRSTTDAKSHIRNEKNNRVFRWWVVWAGTIEYYTWLVQVVRSKFSIKSFCKTSAWPYHFLYFSRFNRHEEGL